MRFEMRQRPADRLSQASQCTDLINAIFKDFLLGSRQLTPAEAFAVGEAGMRARLVDTVPCGRGQRGVAVAGSPAWNPQAMLAEVMSGINSASKAQPSPRSQFRSISIKLMKANRRRRVNGPAAARCSNRPN